MFLKIEQELKNANKFDVSKNSAKETADFINTIAAENFYDGNREIFISKNIIEKIGKKLFVELRGKGLCALM